MDIMKAKMSDLKYIIQIYAYARERMKLSGNPTQWGNNQPSKEILMEDITNNNLYIMTENSQITGVFAFFTGDEPTYQKINGKWLNEFPYGTIHRIASAGKVKGVFNKCMDYCEGILPNIRIDTHQNNKIMQHLLEKRGYAKCGTIYVKDGTVRIAYQRVLDPAQPQAEL